MRVGDGNQMLSPDGGDGGDGPLGPNRLEMLLQLGFELAARHRADQLADHLAALEDEERRDRLHAVLLGYELMMIDIHLRDLDAPQVFVGEGIDRRRYLLA